MVRPSLHPFESCVRARAWVLGDAAAHTTDMAGICHATIYGHETIHDGMHDAYI